MAKELPYFKFDAAEWINGSITLESLEVQGLFINICAYYWFKSGCLKLSEIKRRLVFAQSIAFDSLVSSGIIRVENDEVKIQFLDEQINNLKQLSGTNSNNGRKGGAPKGNKNAQKRIKTTENNRETTENKQYRREEKRREEREDENYPTRQKAFELITTNYHDTETAIKILANRGWKSVQQPQIEALLFHFLELHWATDKTQSDTRSHFRNWLNRENLDNLTKLSITIHERLQA